MQKENASGIKYSESNNPLLDLLFSKEFYISLILPIFIGFFLCFVEERRYVIFLSFILGICSLPLIITIKEIFFKNDNNGNKDLA
jgi:hypothetical protein